MRGGAAATPGLWRTRVILIGGRGHSDYGVTGRLRQVSPSRSVNLSLPLRLSPAKLRSFSGKLVGQFHTTAVAVRCALTVPVHLQCSLTCPSSRPMLGAVYRLFYRQP